uniref:Uncharacterized protein n=1 Tax=Anguilla anguilla TaxID=7936 RepID=A0A0E9VVG3_ANGAN
MTHSYVVDIVEGRLSRHLGIRIFFANISR